MSKYCLLGHNSRKEDCVNGYNCPDFTDVERHEGEKYITIHENCLHLADCMVCDKSHCKSFELEYYMKVKGPGGGYVKGRDANYCPLCGRKLSPRPRPGAIGPDAGEMAPNGDEGAES